MTEVDEERETGVIPPRVTLQLTKAANFCERAYDVYFDELCVGWVAKDPGLGWHFRSFVPADTDDGSEDGHVALDPEPVVYRYRNHDPVISRPTRISTLASGLNRAGLPDDVARALFFGWELTPEDEELAERFRRRALEAGCE